MEFLEQQGFVTGGFPVITDPTEKGYGGYIAGLFISGKMSRSHKKVNQVFAYLPQGHGVKCDEVEFIVEKLPQLFALMHFHTEFLKRRKKIMTVLSSNAKGEDVITGWFECHEKNNLVLFNTIFGADNPDNVAIVTFLTGYCIP